MYYAFFALLVTFLQPAYKNLPPDSLDRRSLIYDKDRNRPVTKKRNMYNVSDLS